MPDEIVYLTPADIYDIAREVLGRRPDVRDRRLLRSASARPMLQAFGAEAYPTLLEKASALLHSLAAHHLFFDGNKRTATRSVTRFLTDNGLMPTWDDDTIYQFVLKIAQHQHDVPYIAEWLGKYTENAPPDNIHIRYLTLDELIYINAKMIEGRGIHTIVEGKRSVRDIDLLEAAVGRPQQSAFGADAYPTLPLKTAALLHSITRNHPFADGNKRTATVAAIFMLAVNGHEVVWDMKDALEMIISVAEGYTKLEIFADWLVTTPHTKAPNQDAVNDAQHLAEIIENHGALLKALAER